MYGQRTGLTVKNNNSKTDIFSKLNSLIEKLPKVLTSKNVDTNNFLFSKMNSSIKKLSESESLLQKRLNDLEIQKIEILRQELLELEKKKLTILSIVNKY